LLLEDFLLHQWYVLRALAYKVETVAISHSYTFSRFRSGESAALGSPRVLCRKSVVRCILDAYHTHAGIFCSGACVRLVA
jgi:hypothetical protein